jgi:hypothetical protein
VRKKRRKKIALAVAGAGAMALAGASMLTKSSCPTEMKMGEAAIAGSVAVPVQEPPSEEMQGQMRMGDWAPPPEVKEPRVPPAQPREGRHMMGIRKR